MESSVQEEAGGVQYIQIRRMRNLINLRNRYSIQIPQLHVGPYGAPYDIELLYLFLNYRKEDQNNKNRTACQVYRCPFLPNPCISQLLCQIAFPSLVWPLHVSFKKTIYEVSELFDSVVLVVPS